MEKKKYPDIEVHLTGNDGNAFAILGRCKEAMDEADCTEEQWNEFHDEATSGDYDHLLQTCLTYFKII